MVKRKRVNMFSEAYFDFVRIRQIKFDFFLGGITFLIYLPFLKTERGFLFLAGEKEKNGRERSFDEIQMGHRCRNHLLGQSGECPREPNVKKSEGEDQLHHRDGYGK